MKSWTREKLAEEVKTHMLEKRWRHTLGVVDTAVMLAKRFGGDPTKADLAALLHDVAKYWPVNEQRQWIESRGLEPDLLHYDKELWHGPVGAEFAREQYGVEDEEVLDAIRYHTSGRERMTLMDKIVCLADYMEPGRDFPGVDRIREISETSLEEALVAGFDSTISYLLQTKRRVYPLTIMARNDLLQQKIQASH